MPGNLQIQGGAFRDAQANVLTDGFLVFQLSRDALYAANNAQVVGGIPISVPLDNTGNVPSDPGIFLYSSDVLSPALTYYIVNAYRSDGTRAWRAQQFWTLPSTTNPLDLGTIIPSNPPPQGLSGSSANVAVSTLSVSSNTTLNNVTGILFVFATGGSSGVTITYPVAAANTSALVITKKIDSGLGAVTVAANLDNLGNYSLANLDQYVSGASDGSLWRIVGNN